MREGLAGGRIEVVADVGLGQQVADRVVAEALGDIDANSNPCQTAVIFLFPSTKQ